MTDVWGGPDDDDEGDGGVWRDPGGIMQKDRPGQLDEPDDEERAYNARVLGVTYRERYGARDHTRCVIYCCQPRSGRRGLGAFSHGLRCPDCYGRAVSRSIHGEQVEPEPTRLGRLIGYLVCAVLDAAEVIRWHPHAPLLTLRWRVPRYLECPECAQRARAEKEMADV